MNIIYNNINDDINNSSCGFSNLEHAETDPKLDRVQCPSLYTR